MGGSLLCLQTLYSVQIFLFHFDHSDLGYLKIAIKSNRRKIKILEKF